MTSKRSFIPLTVISKFRNVLLLALLFFLQAKAMLNNFRVFEELVFFDLWIPVPESGFRFPGVRGCPALIESMSSLFGSNAWVECSKRMLSQIERSN